MTQTTRPVPRRITEAADSANNALEGFFGSHEVVAASLLAIAMKINEIEVPQHLRDTLIDMADDLEPEPEDDAPESHP